MVPNKCSKADYSINPFLDCAITIIIARIDTPEETRSNIAKTELKISIRESTFMS